MEGTAGGEDSSGLPLAATAQLDINDPNVEEKLVNELKEQGIFDQLRKDCLADVDTKPGYQNLKQRVDNTLDAFLQKHTWNPGLNKNQLRAQLRKQIEGLPSKDVTIERIVDQIVDPKIGTALQPEVEAILVKYFGDRMNESLEESQDIEMADDANGKDGTAAAANGETESISSEDEPGLQGHMSPLTPGREENNRNGGSPGAGSISPLTPPNPPPLPTAATVVNMEVENQVEIQEGGTPPPKEESPSYTPPPRQEEQSYTPPLPAQQESYTPPPPSEEPPLPSPPTRFPAQPPPPGDSGSGEDASMSSISDTEMADVSPPRPAVKTPPMDADTSATADSNDGRRSNTSPTRHIPLPEESSSSLQAAGGGSKAAGMSSNNPPMGEAISSPEPPGSVSNKEDKGESSDASLSQLEKMKADLMAKLGEDFKLSPEEDSSSDDSEGELDTEGDDRLRSKPSKEIASTPSGSNSDNNDKTTEKSSSSSDEEKSATREEAKKSEKSAEKSSSSPTPSSDEEKSAKSESSPENSPKNDTDEDSADGKGDKGADRSRDGSGGEGGEGKGGEERNKSPPPPPGQGPSPPPPDSSQSGDQGPTPPPPPSHTDQQLSANNQLSRDRITNQHSANSDKVPTVNQGPRSISPPNQLQTIRSLPLPPMEETPSSSRVDKIVKGPVTPPEPCEPPPLPRRGPVTPPEPCDPTKPASPPPPKTPPSPFSAFNPDSRRPPSPPPPTGLLNHKEADKKSSSYHHSSSSKSRERKEKEKEKDKEREKEKDRKKKEIEKIKEKQAKMAKMEQKVKSKDKMKSDKYQALDIFSTMKKPVTPHQPYRAPTVSGTVTTPTNTTPVTSKTQSKRHELNKSVSKEHSRQSSSDHKNSGSSDHKSSSFSKPAGKISDRRRSSTDVSSSRDHHHDKSRDHHHDKSRDHHHHDKSRDHHHHDKKSAKTSSSRESSKDPSENSHRRHSLDRSSSRNDDHKSSSKDHHHHKKDDKKSSKDSSSASSKDKHKDRAKEKVKSRRESVEDSKESDREKFIQETKKRLVDERRKKEEKEKESRTAEKESRTAEKESRTAEKKKAAPSSGAASQPSVTSPENIKKQLQDMTKEALASMLLSTLTQQGGATPNNLLEQIQLEVKNKDTNKHKDPAPEKVNKKEANTSSSKKKIVLRPGSSDENSDIEVLNDTSHKKKDSKSPPKIDTEKSAKSADVVKSAKSADMEKSAKTQKQVRDLTKSTTTPAASTKPKSSVTSSLRRKQLIASSSESEGDDSSSEEEMDGEKLAAVKSSLAIKTQEKKKATSTAAKKPKRAVRDESEDSEGSDDYVPDKEVLASKVSPEKKMKTRGVKVNLNKLPKKYAIESQEEENDSSSSDSNFEVNFEDEDVKEKEGEKKQPINETSTEASANTKAAPVPPKKVVAKKESAQQKTSTDNPKKSPPKEKKQAISTPAKIAQAKQVKTPKSKKVAAPTTTETTPAQPSPVKTNQDQPTTITKAIPTPPPPPTIKKPVVVARTPQKVSPIVENVEITTSEESESEEEEEIVDPFDGFQVGNVEESSRRASKFLDSLKDEENVTVGEVSDETLFNYLPETKTIEIDLPPRCRTTDLVTHIENELGGGARTFNPIPEWLVPYLLGAKCKPEELELPSEEEIAANLKKQQKKAKKRGCGYDIVVEWVPTPTTNKQAAKNMSRAERQLRNDPFSTFFAGIEESGGKRCRRANNRYSSQEYSISGESESAESAGGALSGSEEKVQTVEVKKEPVSVEPEPTKIKSSKERINAYLRSAGVDRQLPNSGTDKTSTIPVIKTEPDTKEPETAPTRTVVETAPIETAAETAPTANETAPTPSQNGDETAPTVGRRTRRRSSAADKSALTGDKTCDNQDDESVSESRPRKRLRANSGVVVKTEPCDENSVKSEGDATNAAKMTAADKTKQDIDNQLEATEAEMEAVLTSLASASSSKKRRKSGGGPQQQRPTARRSTTKQESGDTNIEFYGWSADELCTPPRRALPTTRPPSASENPVDPGTVPLTSFAEFGPTFGLGDLDDLLPGEEKGDSNLDIIMSPAFQRDYRQLQKRQKLTVVKQETTSATSLTSDQNQPLTIDTKASTMLRKVGNDLDLRNGSEGSDSDDKGSVSPVSSEPDTGMARRTRKASGSNLESTTRAGSTPSSKTRSVSARRASADSGIVAGDRTRNASGGGAMKRKATPSSTNLLQQDSSSLKKSKL